MPCFECDRTEYILAADVVYIDVIAMLCFLDTTCRAISLHPIKAFGFESGIEMVVIVFISVMIVMITSTKFISLSTELLLAINS